MHLKSLIPLLAGRQLFDRHLSKEQRKLLPTIPAIQAIPGISTSSTRFGGQRFTCNRCYTSHPHHFHSFQCKTCQQLCTYCVNCIQMKRISTCGQLYHLPPLPFQTPSHYFYDWQGQYSDEQQQAVDELLHAIQHNTPHLIHAVCGSGKTEMMFAGIHAYLQNHQQVAVASPRTDVILELAPRFQQVFQHIPIQVLYGDSADRDQPFSHGITLTTTHQLFKFKHAFDAIFVDEADAFPYHFDKTLQQAVQQAVKPNAPVHAITATPNRQLLQTYASRSVIAIRYHGYLLPTPRFQAIWSYEKKIAKGQLPPVVERWIVEKIKARQPFLLFVYSIAAMEKIEAALQALHESIRIVHAASDERKELVQQLREGKRVGLATTTILERGVTLKNIQVAVLGADQAIFTKEALVQIGGRVGRNTEYPAGDFILFHAGRTEAMFACAREMKQLNERAMTTTTYQKRREADALYPLSD